MKILVLGSNGLLGKYFCSSKEKKVHDLVEINRNLYPEVNFMNPDSVTELLRKEEPDTVVNCVAVTSFEACNKDYEAAYQINANTPSDISKYCHASAINFIHISTDHFFGSDELRLHTEEDPISLVNNYAISKYEGEQMVLENDSSLVLRTSIIGRTLKQRTFLDWAIKAIKDSNRVGLFSDSYTSFIHCNQLCSIIFELLNKEARGLFNVSCSEVFTKAEFCIELANRMDFDLNYYLTSSKSQKIKKATSCGLSSKKLYDKYSIKTPSFIEVIEASALEEENFMH